MLVDKGGPFRKIGEALFLDEETVSKHFDEYCETKKLSIPTGGSQRKLSPAQTTELIQHLKEKTYTKRT
ncbi:hypothetical protein AGMMS49949_04140 [Alphaproteobacteria bacterium]|nr:hypothetical protein AGMMS49949_04140 [Alphaproteobacteria bacterium]